MPCIFSWNDAGDGSPAGHDGFPVNFTVRYWSSLLPEEFHARDGGHYWVDYSVHPGSKLGLHNAMLAVHDRCEILEQHGGHFECAVFVSEGEHLEKLSPPVADSLFATLPYGEVKWLDIHACMLPPPPAATSAQAASPGPERPAEQLPLFAHVHTHTAYDDLDPTPHAIDVDI